MFPDYNAYSQYYGLNGGFGNGNNFANNGLSNGFDFRSMNGGMMNMNSDEIITLSQAVQMIRKTLGESREDEMFLDKLMKLTPSDRDKEIIGEIKTDKNKHDKILRDVHYSLTGQMAGGDYQMERRPEKPDKPDNNDKKYLDMLEDLLFDKFECIVKFRKILSVMPSGENYTLIMAILTDDIKNAGKINFLIHRAK